MKKRILSFILSICILVMCCACSNQSNKDIIGTWMREDGYTISFIDESSCSFGEGTSQTYKIYNKNHLKIEDSDGNEVAEYVFEIDGDTLNLQLGTEDGYSKFTKNTEEQKKILEKQTLQEQINTIQAQIDSYKNDITHIQEDIDRNISAIENNKADIIKWEEAIEQEYIDCQEAIDFGDNKEYQENQRDDFIAAHKESIQSCNDRIAELEAVNISYQENINLIIAEIEKLEKQIEELKEQQ